MDIEEVGVLVIKENGEVTGLIYNNVSKRTMEFFSTKKMGMDDIKEKLTDTNIWQKQTPVL